MNENSGGTPGGVPGGTPNGTPNPLNPAPLQPIEPETPETPEMMAGPWNGASDASAEPTNTGDINASAGNTTAESQESHPATEAATGITANDAMAAGQAGIAAGRARAMRAARTPQASRVARRTQPGMMQDVVRTGAANTPSVDVAHAASYNTAGQSGATSIEDVVAGVVGTANTAGTPPASTTGTMNLAAMHARRSETPMPIPKDSVVGAKSKKHGLIIALVLLLIAAIGAAVAAILILKPFDFQKEDDQVAVAIEKLLTNKPQKLSLKGSVIVSPRNSSPYSQMIIKFDSGLDIKSDKNFANATVQMALEDGGALEFGVEEIRTSDGDLYLRLSGLAEAIANYAITIEPTDDVTAGFDPAAMTNCVSDVIMSGDPMATTNCMQAQAEPLLAGLVGLVEMIDNEWLRIPMGESASATELLGMDEDMLCLVEAAGHLDGLGKIYQAHPFITAKAVDPATSKSRNQVYELSVNDEIYDEFDSKFRDSEFMKAYRSCMGNGSSTGGATTQQTYWLTGIESAVVEIDDNDNITRLTLSPASDVATIALDVEIGYPASVTVDEPEYYTDLEQLFQEIFMQMFDGDIYE